MATSNRLIAVITATLLLLSAPAGEASAAPTTASPSNSNAVQAFPVVLPGMTPTVTVRLGNFTALPTVAQVRFHGWCWDSTHKMITFETPRTVVTVPGDPRRPPGLTPLRVVDSSVSIPQACIAQPDTPVTTHDGEFFADFGGVDEKPTGTFMSHFWIGKPFNLANIRHNLSLATRGTPATSQAHHTLPQKYLDTFAARGLNIHDPAHLRWWCSKPGLPTNHQSKASSYNVRWDQWFETHKTATASDMLAFRESIQSLYVYTC